MKRPWMPLYIPDFLADTMHLPAAETGAYLCLIMDYWLHDGLPDDDHKLAQIARLPVKSWHQMRPTIEAFFHDGWRHKRIDAELAKMVGTQIKRKESATKAGNQSALNASIARERNRVNGNAASTQRQRHVDAASTPGQRGVDHSTQESITTTSRDTARASQNGQNPPENEPKAAKPQASSAWLAPAGFAEKAREAIEKNSGSIGSGELSASIQNRGWVK